MEDPNPDTINGGNCSPHTTISNSNVLILEGRIDKLRKQIAEIRDRQYVQRENNQGLGKDRLSPERDRIEREYHNADPKQPVWQKR